MRFRVVRTWAFGISFLAASLQTGCALSPSMHQDGLPRISRYTNPLQLNWALSRYAELAGHSSEQTPDVVRRACQGWQRMAFDLASARAFPKAFRMSAEGAGLLASLDELPTAVARHPLPESCAPKMAAQAAAEPPSALHPAPAPTAQMEPVSKPALAVAAPVGTVAVNTNATSNEQSGNSLSPAAPQGGTTPDAQPAQQAASTTTTAAAETAPPAAMAMAPAARPAPVIPAAVPALDEEALQWQRLRSASAVQLDATDSKQAAAPNLAELAALAESAIPAIRLRARYHLLGHCANAVADQDRLGTALPTAKAACWGHQGQEPLRVTQNRLLRSMLSAWRGRGPEPLSDLVVALASFAARDNPVLDGPRMSR